MSSRTGDLARIEPHVTSSASAKKPKKALAAASELKESQAEGVVYKVLNARPFGCHLTKC
jgi:hypothetical protein